LTAIKIAGSGVVAHRLWVSAHPEPPAGVGIILGKTALPGLILMAEPFRQGLFLPPDATDIVNHFPGILAGKYDNENSNHGNQNG
jgi:hypothetical protein